MCDNQITTYFLYVDQGEYHQVWRDHFQKQDSVMDLQSTNRHDV